MSIDRLWAGWRTQYVESAAAVSPGECAFCEVLSSDRPDQVAQVVWRDEQAAALLNLFPYTSGHLLVLPVRHVGELEDLTAGEATAVWSALAGSVRALKAAYQPDGLNVGANLGRAAGAGIPGHFHLHALARWNGDTNFLTALADVRVLPETLAASGERVRAAWPDPGTSRGP